MKREDVPPRMDVTAQILPDWALDLDMLQTIHRRRIKVDSRLRDLLATPHVVNKMMAGRARVKAVLRSLQTQADWDNVFQILLIPGVPFPRTGLLPRFPPPPFPDTPQLTALRTARSLKSESYRLSHCGFSHYADQVRLGYAYFYRWEDCERVTVAIVRGPDSRWAILDLRSFANEPPGPMTQSKIIAALAEALGDRFNNPTPKKESTHELT